ncbi:FeoA family protein [Glaciecola sp.]|jgi:ferrous iron transport protein A|uniref:FeoA family protein n=1 Tax=Glaciecola sp. MF2-115 TaxID=3384827 RepID=UPI00398901B9
MTVWDIPSKKSASITDLCISMQSDVAIRLQEMGFEEGQLITCIKRTAFNGPTIIQLGDCVYSLEQSIANHVNVNAI